MLLAKVFRNKVVESLHFGSIVIVDNSHTIIYECGDIDNLTYMRSTAKPIQASLTVSSGAYEHFKMNNEELAIISSSHSGEDSHIKVLKALSAKLNLHPNDLLCGISLPLLVKLTSSWVYANKNKYTQLHCDCSGKHLGIIATCKKLNLSIHNYNDINHPIQNLIIRRLSEISEIKPGNISIGLDGCGIPTYAIPLRSIAFVYAQLGKVLKSLPENYLYPVVKSMCDFPHLLAGTNRLVTELMKITKSRLVVKCGAEGLYAISFPERGLGLAIKFADGSSRSASVVLTKILLRFDLISHVEANQFLNVISPLISDHHGNIVGEIVSQV